MTRGRSPTLFTQNQTALVSRLYCKAVMTYSYHVKLLSSGRAKYCVRCYTYFASFDPLKDFLEALGWIPVLWSKKLKLRA